MDSKKELYQIEFTEDCRDEIREIYKYISENLQAEEAAKRLMKKMRDSVYELAESPRMFVEIPNNKKRKLSFRRMVVDNKKLFIFHICSMVEEIILMVDYYNNYTNKILIKCKYYYYLREEI